MASVGISFVVILIVGLLGLSLHGFLTRKKYRAGGRDS